MNILENALQQSFWIIKEAQQQNDSMTPKNFVFNLAV